MNVTALLGRPTTDIELRTTTSGKSVVSFTLAVRRKYSKDATDFIPVVAWEKTADFLAKYVSKGQMIGIDGSIQTRTYTDKNGNKRQAVEVVADNAYFAGEKADNAANASAMERTNNVDDYSDDSDLPF